MLILVASLLSINTDLLTKGHFAPSAVWTAHVFLFDGFGFSRIFAQMIMITFINKVHWWKFAVLHIARSIKFNVLLKVPIILLLAFSSQLYACEKTITIQAYKNWLPYSYEVNGVFQGLDIEALELVLAKANICWEYVSLPSTARAFAEMKKGNIDLVFAASMSDERSQFAYFTTPYRTESAVLYKHVDNAQDNLTETTTVAINRGGFYGSEFADYRDKCQDCVIDISLASQRFYLLKNKRVDFVIEDSLAGQYIVENSEFSKQVKTTGSVIHNNMVHYMIARDSLSDNELALLNNVIEQNQGEIKALIDKYQR